MKPLRKILFWGHLVIGLTAGFLIALMAATGISIAFEPQIMAALERDVRFVPVPAPDAPRLPLDTLTARLRETAPTIRVQGLTVYADPAKAVTLTAGAGQVYYANPYTGEIKQPSARAKQAHTFLHFMEDLHRALGGKSGERRANGRAVTGVANLVFLALALSGLYLWWPRNWTWRAIRPSVLFTRGARGKARDWNWHNVIGLWATPVLIVTTFTGAVISYKWATNLVYTLAGATPPPARAATPEISKPAPGTAPLSYDAQFLAARAHAPADWTALSLRPSLPAENTPAALLTKPTNALIRTAPWDPPALLPLDPYTGSVLSTPPALASEPGRRLRSLVVPLHTGRIVGWPLQLLMATAALGALVLVYTGFAMAIRRFFPRRTRSSPVTTTRPPAVLADDGR